MEENTVSPSLRKSVVEDIPSKGGDPEERKARTDCLPLNWNAQIDRKKPTRRVWCGVGRVMVDSPTDDGNLVCSTHVVHHAVLHDRIAVH